MVKPGAYGGKTDETPPLSPFPEGSTEGAGRDGGLSGLTPVQQDAVNKIVDKAKEWVAKKVKKETARDEEKLGKEKKRKKGRQTDFGGGSLTQKARKFVNKKSGSILKTAGQREKVMATVMKIWKHGSRVYQKRANTSFFPGMKGK